MIFGISNRILAAVVGFAPVVLFYSSGSAPSSVQSVDSSAYVGSQACVECHKSESAQFHKTVHATAKWDEKKYGSGCESCHGPGKAHADAMKVARGDDEKIQAAVKLIFSFRSSAAENSSRCLTCHVTNHEQALFNRSEHQLHGVACQTCHAPHLVEAGRAEKAQPVRAQAQLFSVPDRPAEQRWLDNKLLRKPEPNLCFMCHKVVEGQFALPNHHKVPEGLMKCTDCHNAHGTRSQPMLRKTSWEACVACHTEKRGPYVFEHASVKIEGCVTCHSPHGTVSRMMLLRREDRFLCLQCHINPNADNVPHGRLSFQTRGDCIRCHAAIHGSNFSPFFLN